ncbi:MAG: hypothetical protein JWN46_2976 [Acidimicrobiales bacterium]|nr:hypothetical protein [Acidimicrobiales bacterium]
MSRPSITPDPSDEETAAIVAALELTRPAAGGTGDDDPSPRWRWSGRWWSKPIPSRRVRPW